MKRGSPSAADPFTMGVGGAGQSHGIQCPVPIISPELELEIAIVTGRFPECRVYRPVAPPAPVSGIP